MKFYGPQPHYFVPLPCTYDLVLSIISTFIFASKPWQNLLSLITLTVAWLWEQSRAHFFLRGTDFTQKEAMRSPARKTLWARTEKRQGFLDALIFLEVSEQVAVPPTHKVSPDSSQFFCVSWNHFLRVTLTYVPINKLATPSQLTHLAETRSSCANVWVNSCAHPTGKDQVYPCVPSSQVMGCRKLFFFLLVFTEIDFDLSI